MELCSSAFFGYGPSVLLGVLTSSLFGSLPSSRFSLTRVFGVDYIVLTSVSQGSCASFTSLVYSTGKCDLAVSGFTTRTQASQVHR